MLFYGIHATLMTYTCIVIQNARYLVSDANCKVLLCFIMYIVILMFPYMTNKRHGKNIKSTVKLLCDLSEYTYMCIHSTKESIHNIVAGFREYFILMIHAQI